MSMHISPTITIGTEPARIASKFPQMSPIATLFPPATQSDITGTLQRKQDRDVSLLSSSPLLSYANFRLQGEIDKLRTENLEMTKRLEAATASMEESRPQTVSLGEANVAHQQHINSFQAELLESKDKHSRLAEDSKADLEAVRSQVVFLEEVNVAQRQEMNSLWAELLESKDKHSRLAEDSNAERDALRSTISDLEVQRADLKETITQQQLKISAEREAREAEIASFEAATASLEAVRSQVVSLEEVNVARLQYINSLREELLDSEDKHSRLVEDSKVERDALRSTISGLEVQRAELRKTIFQQQLKISDLEYRGLARLGRAEKGARMATLYGEQKARKEAREKTEQEARAKAQREARKMERWEERWEMEEMKRLEMEEREVAEWREDRWEKWEEKWERRQERRERRERWEMERQERRGR